MRLAMSWFYAVRNEQKGPVSEEEFRALVARGVIGPDTLVWRDGMADWLPYSRSPAADAPASGDGIVCAECGGKFPFDQVIRVGERFACPQCQPVAMEKLREELGAAAGIQTPAELRMLDYPAGVLGCIGRGLGTLARQCLPIYGVTLIFMAIFAGLNLVSINPIIDMLLAGVLSGPLMGGYWNYMVRKARGDETSPGNVFAGFGAPFPQLFLGYLVPSVLAGLCLLPGAFVMGIGAAMAAAGSQAGQVAMLLGAGFGMLGMFGFIYLTNCWFHTLPLVIDKRMGFWSAMGLSRAMVARHWWSNFLIGFLIVPIAFGPLIAFNVELALQLAAHPEITDLRQLMTPQIANHGLIAMAWTFLAGPLFFAAYAHRYNDMFGPLVPQNEY